MISVYSSQPHSRTIIAGTDCILATLYCNDIAEIGKAHLQLLCALHRQALRTAMDRSNELMLFNAGAHFDSEAMSGGWVSH
jgi:hypothetical protein